ncbi:MAG TPA: FecR domain-containing protein [Puia sp.]|nr:FecR domain-containing protein [Puia sp.]
MKLSNILCKKGFSQNIFAPGTLPTHFFVFNIGQLSMKEKKFHKQLLKRYLENKATEEELKVFMHLLQEGKLDEAFALALEKESVAPDEDLNDPKVILLWRRMAVAASIVLVIGLTSYLLLNHSSPDRAIVNNTKRTQEIRFKNDIQAPQVNKAILTLANGSTIVLDSAHDGLLARQGNVNVLKSESGKIAYKGGNSFPSEQITYNTIRVPKGSRPFHLQLADGSEVWLNVASSITFPTSFVGNERMVKITGEAYFEIAHDATRPFIVSKGEASVQVLGTHFNVNAYDDEPDMKVTLLEGSVEIKTQKANVRIKPGEQAAMAPDGTLVINNKADIDEAMAWKNGRFEFNNADIATVMRQISRWYNVEVSYQGKIPFHFGGQIARGSSLVEIFKILEISGVKFTIDGNKVNVLP